MRKGRTRHRAGVHTAIAATVIAVGIGAVGVAGADSAATEHEIHATSGTAWQPSRDITIQTGDTVKWTFDPAGFHNVEARGDNWTLPANEPSSNHQPVVSQPFTTPGTYRFTCVVHQGGGPSGMDGTITVQDTPPTPTPTPTATATPIPTATATPIPTATASPTPSPTPSVQSSSGQPATPAPSGSKDTVKPSLRDVRLTAQRRATRVRFTLSEPATVTVTVRRRGSRAVLKSVLVQARAGTRTVMVRSARLKEGRYTLAIQARDAAGNRSALTTKRLTISA